MISSSKRFLILISLIFTNNFASGQTQEEKENIIVQMNYCINALTNIANNQSMTVLNYEAEQILNNLKVTNIRREYELQNFRIELFDAIRNLQITEKEKEIISRIQELKSKNLMWKSLSSALNPTMLITGGGNLGPQAAFQAMVAAARVAVDYQTTKGENEIEEIQAMWEIKKKELEEIGRLRSNALKITFALYDRYNFLDEWDRLTEDTSQKFNEIISEPIAEKRVRRLKENEGLFKMIPDYYYHLGMSIIEDKSSMSDSLYYTAKKYLDIYLEKYEKNPIFRYNQKSGIIALTQLAYDENLSDSKKESLITTALANLPNNGSALLQCALVYILDLNDYVKGYELLRSGLDNNYSNINEILSTITFFIDDIKNYPSIYRDVLDAINSSDLISLNEYLSFIITNGNNVWNSIGEVITIDEGPIFSIKQSRDFDCSEICIYKVNYSNKKAKIRLQNLIPKESFTEKELNKVDAFSLKGNENLKYEFVEPVIFGERYVIKRNIDYNAIRNKEFQSAGVFTIEEGEEEDIIEFCEKYERTGLGMKIEFSNSEENVKQKNVIYSLLDQFHYPDTLVKNSSVKYALSKSDFTMEVDYFGRDSISFIPVKFENTTGNYLVIDLIGLSHIVITYKEDDSNWVPYSIEKNGKIEYCSEQIVLDPNRPTQLEVMWDKTKDGATQVYDWSKNQVEIVGEKSKTIFNKMKFWEH